MGKTHFPRTGGNQWVSSFYNFDSGPFATSGDVYFVGSTVTGATDSAGYGRSPESPFATLKYALATACTANNGDVVVALAGHTEAVIADGTITASKAGVRVVGIGVGRLRPIITYTTAAAASVNVTAANVSFENIVFKGTGVDAVTAMVNVSTADVSFIDCEFETADATNQAVLGILTAATATRLRVERCHFHGTGDAGTATAIRHVAGADVVIKDNIFIGAYTTTLGAIDNTAAVLGLQVLGNTIVNLTASSAKGVVAHASTTGVVANNRIAILTGTAPIAGAAIYWLGNYYAAGAATAGTLV